LVSFADDQRQTHPHVARDRGETPRRFAIPEVRGPAANEPVDTSDDRIEVEGDTVDPTARLKKR